MWTCWKLWGLQQIRETERLRGCSSTLAGAKWGNRWLAQLFELQRASSLDVSRQSWLEWQPGQPLSFDSSPPIPLASMEKNHSLLLAAAPTVNLFNVQLSQCASSSLKECTHKVWSSQLQKPCWKFHPAAVRFLAVIFTHKTEPLGLYDDCTSKMKNVSGL